MTEYLAKGAVLGLSAGFAPGPLLALVIAETLRHGRGAGIRVALAPIVTDVPIVALTLFILSRLSQFHTILGGISVLGGFFVLYLGWESIRTSGVTIEKEGVPSRSLRKGIAINALSPHPYLFWISVGGPVTWQARESGLLPAALFIGSFYLLLVGSKIGLAVIVGRSRSFLTGRVYLVIMRILGLALCLLALLLIRDGLGLIL